MIRGNTSRALAKAHAEVVYHSKVEQKSKKYEKTRKKEHFGRDDSAKGQANQKKKRSGIAMTETVVTK